MANFDTAGNLINHAAVECGLAAVSDPFASTDPNFIQFTYLLKTLGEDLWKERRWTHLLHTKAFSTFYGQASYDLPADFGEMVDQTWWNRTNRVPMGGPLGAQEWQYLKGQLVGIVFTVLFRPLQGKFWVYPDTSTPAGYSLAYEYVSRYWVQTAAQQAALSGLDYRGDWAPVTAIADDTIYTNGGRNYHCTNPGTSGGTAGSVGPTGTGAGITDGSVTWDYLCDNGTTAPSASTDVVSFDAQLIRRGLVLYFKEAKGFDTTKAQDRYDEALEKAIAADSPSQILSLSGKGMAQVPLISEANVPITGFGS